MKKADQKIKKTFVRTSEQRIREPAKVVYDVENGLTKQTVQKPANNELNQPKLCSSEVLANYLTEAKKTMPLITREESKVDKVQLNNKMTKKLNFHCDDHIYKNLVQLNADVACVKNKKDHRAKVPVLKKDLEPNIDDFCNDEKEEDICPNIPVIKPKFRPIRKFESGQLHKLVASLEIL